MEGCEAEEEEGGSWSRAVTSSGSSQARQVPAQLPQPPSASDCTPVLTPSQHTQLPRMQRTLSMVVSMDDHSRIVLYRKARGGGRWLGVGERELRTDRGLSHPS
jgi:hypothetical protein